MTAGSSVAPAVAPVASLRFVRAYVVTMRPYLLFVSGIAGLAGLALGPTLPAAETLLLGAVFFLSYGFGQALTDCFQTDTDTISSPYRPLVQGTVRRCDVLVVSLVGLAISGAVVVSFARVNLLLAALTVAGLLTYTPLKRRWWGGPPWNAWIVTVLCLIGYASAAGRLDWSPLLGATLAAVFFGYANFVLTGYFKDVSADRATGYLTLPVVCGLRVSAVVSDVLAVLALAGAVAALVAAGPSAAGTAFVAAASVASVLAQLRLHRVRNERAAHAAITPVVHAFVLMLAGVAVTRQPGWLVPLLLYYGAFAVTLRRRPAPEQV
jgi:4-hydroxybenzoate polyprenyltransferase